MKWCLDLPEAALSLSLVHHSSPSPPLCSEVRVSPCSQKLLRRQKGACKEESEVSGREGRRESGQRACDCPCHTTELTMPALMFSPPLPSTFPALSAKTQIPQQHLHTSLPRKTLSIFVAGSADHETGAVSPVDVEAALKKEEVPVRAAVEEKKPGYLQSNGVAVKVEASAKAPQFKDPRWAGGTWDLELFRKGGGTDWDAVIDAEARRRKWLEENPEASSNDDPVVFDTSIIPWWAWVKRFHLPEAELLNGRAAMIGFVMAYLVDALTGVGLVDQMGNYFCKTLLLVAVAGVLLIRKNEDIETLKKLVEETTFYDKQWQATWKDESASDSTNE